MFEQLQQKINDDFPDASEFILQAYKKHHESIQDAFVTIKDIVGSASDKDGKLKVRMTRPAISALDMFLLFLLSTDLQERGGTRFVEVGSKYGWSMMTTGLALKPPCGLACYEISNRYTKTLNRRASRTNKLTTIHIQDGLARLKQMAQDNEQVDQLFVDADHVYGFAKQYICLPLLDMLSDIGQIHFHDFHLNPQYNKNDRCFGESYAVIEWYNQYKARIDKDYLCVYAGRFVDRNPVHSSLLKSYYNTRNFFSRNDLPSMFYKRKFFSMGDRTWLYGSLWFISRNRLANYC